MFELFADQEATLAAVAEDRSVEPDGETHSVRLDSPHSGLHRLRWNDGNDRTEVPVPPGSDGKLWKIEQATGVRTLLTVPPHLARSADELLLPRELVPRP